MENDISGDDRMEVLLLLLESVERVRRKGTWSVGDRMEFFVGLCEDIHFHSRPSALVSCSQTAYSPQLLHTGLATRDYFCPTWGMSSGGGARERGEA